MASVRRVTRSPFWQAKFRGPDGLPVSKTTKITDREAALCLAREWEKTAAELSDGALASQLEGDAFKEAQKFAKRSLLSKESWAKNYPAHYAAAVRGVLALAKWRKCHREEVRAFGKIAIMAAQRAVLQAGPRSASGYKGVGKQRNKWCAVIHANGRDIYLGAFDTPGEAALAYNAAALKYHGPDAYLNPVENKECMPESVQEHPDAITVMTELERKRKVNERFRELARKRKERNRAARAALTQ